ncbi:MAG TPA: hypothetical protein VGH32_12140 [Pirellulales bacterium]|jgi:hypothetical protein
MATPSRTRDEMREYQRKRRARIKTEAWSAVGMAPAPVLAKDALREQAKARAWAASNRFAPLAPSDPLPKSLCAVGGVPGPGLIPCGPGYPAPPDMFAASAYGQFMARTESMLAALAARSDAQEQRIAALEKRIALRETATNQVATVLASAMRKLIGLRP